MKDYLQTKAYGKTFEKRERKRTGTAYKTVSRWQGQVDCGTC